MLPNKLRNDSHIRTYQINTLKIFNDHVEEVREGQEYKIPFQSGPNELSLGITLTQDFPTSKPILKVSPPVVHQWSNAEGEITSAPGLLNFTIHSDLGRVVQAIIREFERNPPPLVNDCPNSTLTSPTIPIRDGERSSPNYIGINNYSSPTHSSILSTTSHQSFVFPELNKLSLEELEFLNNNVDRQDEFLNELPSIKEQNRLLDDLITQVEELAESNIMKEAEINELRESIDKKIEEVTKLAFENERLHVKYQELSDKYSPSNIREELRLAAVNAESECEKIAEDFLNGEMDVNRFVGLYTKTRTLCQTRKTKEEKLSQQLVSLEKAGF